MTLLHQYGWTDVHQQYLDNYTQKDLVPARIVSIQGFKYEVMSERGILDTELSGRLLYATEPDQMPKVGDWVLFMDYGSMGYIIEMFPRTNALTRKMPGMRSEVQVLAANIDAALVVQGLDQNYNLNRLERYLVQITSCGITPVVILNKADLVENTDHFSKEVQALGRNVRVHFCSTHTGVGIDELCSSILQPAKTYLLVGSSGVGKSSILNAITKKELQKTSTTSDSNSKGRHTTTTRDLFLLPNGSLLIDSPGMREFGVTGGMDADADLFPLIDQFAGDCKFSDCKHLHEEGCAVLAAIANGSLEQSAYDNYIKLMKEQRRFEINAEDKKRMGKFFGRLTKEAKAHRKKYKF